MENFFSQNSLYVVLTIALICWIGIFSYLMQLDRKISRLEEQSRQ